MDGISFENTVSIINILLYPLIALIGWIYNKREKEAKERNERLENDMQAIRSEVKTVAQIVNKNRDESFERFVTNKSFDGFVSVVKDDFKYLRDKLDLVAVAVGAKKE